MISNIKKFAFSIRTVLKKKFVFDYKNKCSKYEVEKLAIWRHFVISGKPRTDPFLIFVLCSSEIKNYIITGLVSNVFNVPCRKVTFSLQKRKHHKYSV